MKNLIITLPACRDLEAISDYFLASSVEASVSNNNCKFLLRSGGNQRIGAGFTVRVSFDCEYSVQRR
jgi:hypothetical protein